MVGTLKSLLSSVFFKFPQTRDKMVSRMSVVLAVAVALFVVLSIAEATYRKPPFNGSIFGKRANQAVSEYEQAASATKALSSLCEAIAEPCAAWFPNSEANA